MTLTPNLVVPAWIVGVGVVALSVPPPDAVVGVWLFVATVLVIPALLTVCLWDRTFSRATPHSGESC